MLNTRQVDAEGQQKPSGIWPHGWKFEVLQELAALCKSPIACAASGTVESAVTDGAEEDIRQTANSSRKFVLRILIMFWLGGQGECLELFECGKMRENISWGRKNGQSIISTSGTEKVP